MWCPGTQRVEGAACWGAWTGAVSSPQRGSQASLQPSSPSWPRLCRGAGREEKENAGEAGCEGRGQHLPATPSAWPSSRPPAAGLGLCCWRPGLGLPSWTQGGSVSAPKARSSPAPRAWPIPDKPQVCSQVAKSRPPGARGWTWPAHFRSAA